MGSKHSENKNLTISNDPCFGGHGVYTDGGPWIVDYMASIYKTLNNALREHPRTLGVRVELLFSPKYQNDDSRVISRFIDSLRAQISADLQRKRKAGKRVHPCNLRYIWVKEKNTSLNWHYHLVLLLNRDTYNTLGNFNSIEDNMAARIKRAWSNAQRDTLLSESCVARFPECPVYEVNTNSPNYHSEFNDLFYRASYFAKVATKVFANTSSENQPNVNPGKSFGCSLK